MVVLADQNSIIISLHGILNYFPDAHPQPNSPHFVLTCLDQRSLEFFSPLKLAKNMLFPIRASSQIDYIHQ